MRWGGGDWNKSYKRRSWECEVDWAGSGSCILKVVILHRSASSYAPWARKGGARSLSGWRPCGWSERAYRCVKANTVLLKSACDGEYCACAKCVWWRILCFCKVRVMVNTVLVQSACDGEYCAFAKCVWWRILCLCKVRVMENTVLVQSACDGKTVAENLGNMPLQKCCTV
jgi:hypothetical protein